MKIKAERFDRSQCIPFGEGGVYGPDFVVTLGGQSYDVEIKGYEDADDLARYAAWRKQRGPLVVLDQRGLSQMRRQLPHEWVDLFAEYSS